jgi:Zn-dependent peptidase ImmA (M78 family)
MSEQIENLEDQILRATNAFHMNNNTNIAQLAREFSVPYQRLRARIHGRGSKTTAASLKKTLNLIQERALKT